MELMMALVRIAGDLNMTVPVYDVTPAEALLLMRIHDPATKDVFEAAQITGDVERPRLSERERLRGKYPEHGRLIESLFPGRNAADIPDTFGELLDVPLSLARIEQAQAARALDETAVARPEPKGRFVGAPPVRAKKSEPTQQELQDLMG